MPQQQASYMMKPCQTMSKESSQEPESERNKGQAPNVQASKQPKRGRPLGGKGTIKNRTLHQSHEAC